MVDLTSEMEPDYFGGQNGQFGFSLLLFRGEVPQGKSNCGGCIRLSLATLWISAPNTNFSLGSIDVQPHK